MIRSTELAEIDTARLQWRPSKQNVRRQGSLHPGNRARALGEERVRDRSIRHGHVGRHGDRLCHGLCGRRDGPIRHGHRHGHGHRVVAVEAEVRGGRDEIARSRSCRQRSEERQEVR